MNVTVSIDAPDGHKIITYLAPRRPTASPTLAMRQAADLIEDIAADIRRAYPLEGEPTK